MGAPKLFPRPLAIFFILSLPSIFVPIFLEGHLLYSYWDISLPPIVVPIFSKD